MGPPNVTFPLPVEVTLGNGLRWICLALEDISEALGDRIYTLPGRPMESFTEDLGQGETRSVDRSSWYVGKNGVLEAEVAQHEIFDGATPRWETYHGHLRGLAGEAGCLLNATTNVNETTIVRIHLLGPDDVVERARVALESSPTPPGARAL
jgi:hypothetical protein